VKPRGRKRLFASFSSEKEDSSFFEKKEAKKLLFPALARRAVVFGLVALPALGQVHGAVLSDADQATLDRVGAYLNGLRTLTGRFVQIGPDGKTSTGTLWLSRPGRMRFQYDRPSPLLLVAGHGVVVFHDSQLGQTTNIPVGQTPLGLLLADRIALRGDVTVTSFVRDQGQLLITLVRTKTPGDGSLTLMMNEAPLALVGWSVVDAEGRETRLRIADVKQGGAFDEQLFEFKDPDADK
jgi:outer membrane lipoprotein-sorting protein